MQKVIVILIACLITGPLWAQNNDKDSARMALLTAPGEAPFHIEHELQIGVGDILLTNTLYRNDGAFATQHVQHTDLFTPDVYYGAEMTSGAIAVNYTCRTKKWLWFGATLTYSGFYRPAYDRITDQMAYKTREHFVAIMPTIRVSYINRQYIVLYSGMAIGGAVAVYERIPYDGSNGIRNVDGKFVFQVTALGFSVGYKVYAFAELGAGIRGYFYGGVGYRF
ncbi:MAG: hypothetical protein ACI392_06895 [Paludibacteraceae bacterium]